MPRFVGALFSAIDIFCWFSYKNKGIPVLDLQPHSPDNRAPARECKDVKIDRVYIGSCTGGKTEDFLAAAKVFLASVRILNQIMVYVPVIFQTSYPMATWLT